jgi:hypothetical protein
MNPKSLALGLVLAAASAFAGPTEPLLLEPSWAPPQLFLRPQANLLPQAAFVETPPCVVDPFATTGALERAQQLEQACGQDRLRVRVDTPQIRPRDPGPGRYEFQVEQTVTQRLDERLSATARVDWAGAGDEEIDRVMTGRAVVAAGALYRPDPSLDLQVDIGRDAGPSMRTRATVAGAWRPTADDNVVFMEWAAEEAGVANTMGMRWWLVPRRMAVDVTAYVAPDRHRVEPRVGFSLLDWGR